MEQIIQRTKAKADWPDERWDEIRRIAAAAEKPDALVVDCKTVFAHYGIVKDGLQRRVR